MTDERNAMSEQHEIRKAVITGATGMIGAATAGILLQKGISVTAVVRPDSHRIGNLKSAGSLERPLRIVECDLSDLDSINAGGERRMEEDYDAFFHFGWGKTLGAGRNDTLAQEENIRMTLSAVRLAKRLGCHTFIGAGSQAEFGPFEGALSDAVPKNPVTGYGIAKYAAGKLSRIACRELGMRHCWIRILSCYGPGDNPGTMVMSAVRRFLRGEHMSFTRGDQVWDYLYAEDCARAFAAVAEKGVDGKCYTLGSGQPERLREYILEILDAVTEYLRKNGFLDQDPADGQQIISTPTVGLGERDYYPDQVMHLTADISDLTADTGWKPEVSFREGIRRTVDWASREEN